MKKKLFAAALAVIMLLPALVGCSKPPELAEVRDRIVYLIENSYDVNAIYFGDGILSYYDLAGLETEVTEAQRIAMEAEDPYVFYSEVEPTYTRQDGTEVAQITSITEIKSMTEKVYSAEYSAKLYRTYFEDDTDIHQKALFVEIADESGGESSFCKYSLREPLITEKTPQTVFDFEDMKIVKPSSKKVLIVEIRAYNENYYDPDLQEITTGWHYVTLQFANQNGEWFLDSPAY